jgi:hypothetical protein
MTSNVSLFQALSDILSSRRDDGAKPRQKFALFSDKFASYVSYAKSKVEPLVKQTITLAVIMSNFNASFIYQTRQKCLNCQI